MTESNLLIVENGDSAIGCEGLGNDGRRYAIRRCGSHFSASLIAGEGQPITATGKSQLEALRRAEWVQAAFLPPDGFSGRA